MSPNSKPGARCSKARVAQINSVEPLSILYKRNGEMLFGIFSVDAADQQGEPLLPYVLVRGNAVVIVPYCINDDTGEEKFCMIRQRRTGNGRINLEFPAGMLDRDIDNPALIASRELEEETGLKRTPKEMIPLWHTPLFTSVGLADEAILFYGCLIHMSNSEFRSIEGTKAGVESEGEQITVTLKTRFIAEQELCSTQVLLGMDLFERAHRNGKLD